MSIEVPVAEGPSTIEVPVAEVPVARPSAGIHDLLSRPTPRAEEAAADAPAAEELARAEELATVAEPTTGVAFTAEPKGREAPVADGWVSFANPGTGEFPEAKESSAQAPPVEEAPPAEPLAGEPRHTEAPPVKEPRPTQSAHIKRVPPARKAPPGRRGSPAKGSPAKVRPKLPYAPYGPGSARATPEGGGPSGWLVKGRSDTRLYYTPDDPAYPLTVAQVWFKDEQSATRACFTPWRNSSRRK